MNSEIESFVENYLKELREDNSAVFIGAGMSKAAGFVDWAGLLAPLAKEIGLDAQKEHDLVGLAQYHVNYNRGNRHQLNQLLIDQFSDLPEPSENHRILARLPVRVYWTTNYDRLIEKALEASGKRVDAKYTKDQLSVTRRGHDAVVYKMHGDIEHPTNAVLTKDDYEAYHLTYGPFITALSGQLVDTTFLALGFSFSDPNLDYVLSHVRSNFRQHQRRHYCLTKRRTKMGGESDAEFEYASRKQQFIVDDLMRFNVNTVFVDTYSEVTDVLHVIENRFRRRAIFISGSATDYGPWGRPATEEFLVKLASVLIDHNYRINSGFGLGIGGAIVNGAVQQIYSTTGRSIAEQLFIRPFPLGINDATERQRTFDRFRHDLVSQAGVALFIMGNQNEGGAVINSDGVRAEFAIARENGLYVVPIGASGFMAEELWKEVMTAFKTYFPTTQVP
jgi:Sir2- and TIR-associating SLOG family/SIR2-like domain